MIKSIDIISDEALVAHFPRKISKKMKKYVDENLLQHSRYYIYKTKGKKQDGYCTYCNTESVSAGLKHNSKCVCPNCKSKCTARSIGMGRGSLIDRAYFVFYEKSLTDKNAIVARSFYVNKDYTKDYKNIEFDFTEDNLYLFKHGEGALMFTIGKWWKASDEIYKSKTVYSTFNHTGMVHYRLGVSSESIKEAVKDTPYKYSCWEQYEYRDMVKFFEMFSKYPYIEYFTKMGFNRLVEDRLYGRPNFSSINWHGKDICKILKVNKADLKIIQKRSRELTYFFLKVYQLGKRNKLKLTLEEVERISGYHSEYAFAHLDVRKYTTEIKLSNYIDKTIKRSKRKGFYSKQDVTVTLRDYYEDCELLGIDLTNSINIFPKNLDKTHAETSKQVEVKENAAMTAKIVKRSKSLEKYNYEDYKYLIRPAKSSLELIEESKKLSHCVSKYIARYAKGKTNIFFIRSKSEPEKPLYTVEMSGNKITQIKGKCNRRATKEIDGFVKEFIENKSLETSYYS